MAIKVGTPEMNPLVLQVGGLVVGLAALHLEKSSQLLERQQRIQMICLSQRMEEPLLRVG